MRGPGTVTPRRGGGTAGRRGGSTRWDGEGPAAAGTAWGRGWHRRLCPFSPRGHASEPTRAGGAHPQRTPACHRVPSTPREGTARPLGDTATTDGEGCADLRSAALPTTQRTAPQLRHPRGHPGTPGGSHRTDRPGAHPDTPSTAPRPRCAPGACPRAAPAGGGRGDTPQPEDVRVSRHSEVPQLPAPWETDTATGWRHGHGRRGTRLL